MNVAAKWLSLVRDSLDSAVPRLVWDRGGKEGFVSGYSLGWTGGMFEIFQSSSCGVLLVALLSRWHVRNLVNRIAFLIGSDSIWNVLIIHGQAKGLAVSFYIFASFGAIAANRCHWFSSSSVERNEANNGRLCCSVFSLLSTNWSWIDGQFFGTDSQVSTGGHGEFD